MQQPQLETFVVTSKGDTDEVVIRTLLGEYVEQGSNHGRKVYKKSGGGSKDTVEVFMYYWDGRDGPAFEGWWFGNKLGGTQVWSHCTNASLVPPEAGWKIPWDGQVRPTLSVLNKAKLVRDRAVEKLQQMQTEVSQVAAAARTALEQSRALAADGSAVASVREAERTLAPHATALTDALKKITAAQEGSTGDVARQFSQLRVQISSSQNTVNAELAKVRNMATQRENDEKNRALEEKDVAVLQAIMPEATQKTNNAEDAVEKAAITAEMINAAGEDMDECRNAVTQTEAAVQEAQKNIAEARIFLNAKQAAARRLESERIKAEAASELGKLQAQLQEAQNKLTPLKTVRADFQQRVVAQRLAQEVLERLTPAEVDVDRAEEATVLLNGEHLTKEMMSMARDAVTKAMESLGNTLKYIDGKKKGVQGAALEELNTLEERAKASQQRLTALKESHKEAAERVTSEALLREATEKLTAVQEAVGKAADAESPFLMGVEELPVEDALAAVKACETAASSANTSISICRMFLATKSVEAKRFSKAVSADALERLQDYQRVLEQSIKRLAELKSSAAERKRSAVARESEKVVQNAEALTRKVAEAASVFEDDSKLFNMSTDDIKAAAEETSKAEPLASAALHEARKFLTARQIEVKGKDSSPEVSAGLMKMQSRLGAAQAEVQRYKRLSMSVEKRLQAKKLLEEAAAKLAAAEEKVDAVLADAKALAEPSDDPAAAVTEGGALAVEKASTEAGAQLKAMTRYLETQSRGQSISKEEIARMQAKVAELQVRLDSVAVTLKERAELENVKILVAEADARVVEGEEKVTAVAAIEIPDITDGDAEHVEKASAAVTALEEGVKAANQGLMAAKTFLAMKRLAAKKLSDGPAKSALQGLARLQDRIEGANKKLMETRRAMTDRKLATVKREMVAKIAEVDAKVKAAEEATKTLVDTEGEIAPGEMKGACEKVGAAQQEAQDAIKAAKELLESRARDAKTNATDTPIITEIAKSLDKLASFQPAIDKQRAAVRVQEHKFVANRLQKDANDMIEALEKKLQSACEQAKPLVSDDQEGFTTVVSLTHVFSLLKQHAKSAEKAPKAIFDEVSKEGKLAEEPFVAFLQNLPEVKEDEDLALSEETLKAAFQALSSEESGASAEAGFLEHFRNRFLCTTTVSMTDAAVVKGGKTLRKLEAGEIVEGLEEPIKDDGVGLMRMKTRAELDEKEGFVTVAGNQGTVYLEPLTHFDAFQKKIENALREVGVCAKEATTYIEKKTEELRSMKEGPLVDTKLQLNALRPRISKVQFSFNMMKKKVAESSKRQSEFVANERRKRQEAADKKAAEAIKEEANEKVPALLAEAEKFIEPAEALVKSRGADLDDPLEEMRKAAKALDDVTKTVQERMAKTKADIESLNAKGRPTFAEAKSLLVKFKVKIGAADAKCQRTLAGLQGLRKQVEADAHTAVLAAVTAHSLEKGLTAEALFKELSGGATAVPASAFKEFVEKIPESGLKPMQVSLGLDRYKAGGVSKLALMGVLQEYQRVVKEIAITSACQVKDSKTIRKLTMGEIVEVLEAGKADEAVGLERVRCRALADLKEGWVTVKGNQGSHFLQKSSKPYYFCREALKLQSQFEAGGDDVREAVAGEVLELLEGPRKAAPHETVRRKGKARSDGKVGWVTIPAEAAEPSFVPAKVLVCRQSVAITTTFDIAAGKALRKLLEGEILEALEPPEKDEKRSLTRVKAKAREDGKEGYVTLTGNQGTTYAEETDRLQVVKKSTPLEGRFASGGDVLRNLEVDEYFEFVEPPKTETKEGEKRAKTRALSDGTEGWITMTPKAVHPWTPHYVVTKATPLSDAAASEGANAVRDLEVGERLEALGAPALDKASGLLRVQLRADRDGAAGFASVREEGGAPLLSPAADGGR